MDLETYIARAPKAELHLHLQGAIRPETLLQLARRHKVPLPAEDLEGLNNWFQFRDFAHFVEVYTILRSCLAEAEDFELVTHELAAELAHQNVKYAEVTFTPGPEVYRGPRETFFDGLTRGRQRAQAEFGVDIRWIFDIPRRTVTLHPDLPLAEFITDVAINGRHDGVVALGLAGTEAGYPPEPFAPWFERALAAGLHSAPHAGETAGPESIWGALRALGAERLGHGVRAVEDPSLVEYLSDREIGLEVCPTSNIRLGVYRTLEHHPLAELHAAGARISVNTDTPAVFGITLTDEMLLARRHFGLDVQAIDDLILNAFRSSFLAPPERARRVTAVEAELDSLKARV